MTRASYIIIIIAAIQYGATSGYRFRSAPNVLIGIITTVRKNQLVHYLLPMSAFRSENVQYSSPLYYLDSVHHDIMHNMLRVEYTKDG